MKKTKWRLQLDKLEVGHCINIVPNMKEKTLRTYIYGILAKKTGKKFSVKKLTEKTFNITRKV